MTWRLLRSSTRQGWVHTSWCWTACWTCRCEEHKGPGHVLCSWQLCACVMLEAHIVCTQLAEYYAVLKVAAGWLSVQQGSAWAT